MSPLASTRHAGANDNTTNTTPLPSQPPFRARTMGLGSHAGRWHWKGGGRRQRLSICLTSACWLLGGRHQMIYKWNGGAEARSGGSLIDEWHQGRFQCVFLIRLVCFSVTVHSPFCLFIPSCCLFAKLFYFPYRASGDHILNSKKKRH